MDQLRQMSELIGRIYDASVEPTLWTRAALALCDGENIEETAAELGISANTLRTQLKGIYQKTGVDSRAKLVKLVLALAGVRGAPG